MIDIEQLRVLNRPEQIAITEHARRRLVERGIAVNDIIRCIDTGEIIKQYEDDKPFPSCLILGAATEKGLTTSVTDLGGCLIIVRNVPCYKCSECNEIIYTADVVQHLEKIIEAAKKLMPEVSIIDYSQAA